LLAWLLGIDVISSTRGVLWGQFSQGYMILLLFVFFEKRRLVAEIRIYEFTKNWQNGEEY
jgi:hypothetical protein